MDRTFKAGEKFDEPDVQFRQAQFLYDDGEACHFMDVQSYEQFSLQREQVGETAGWLTEGLTLSSVVFKPKPVGVSLPQFVEVGDRIPIDTRTWEFSKRAPK